jgi:ribonuclease HI/DNA-directed RNA polymerase subunit RPC12/RpoP
MNEENCRNCGYRLIQKATKKSAGQLRKPYYYTAYYYCTRCQKLYHSDKFKVINNPLFEIKEKAPLATLGEKIVDPNTYDAEIWTDGACVYNGTPRARAAWGFVSGETERAGLVTGKQTNNVAEGLAIYHALVWAAEKGYKKVKIYSDSLISLNNMKKPAHKVIQNTEIFLDIAEVIERANLNVTFEKVLGHSGDINNERADKLCNSLATKG